MKKLMTEWRTFMGRQVLLEQQENLDTVGDLMSVLAKISTSKKLGFAKDLGL